MTLLKKAIILCEDREIHSGLEDVLDIQGISVSFERERSIRDTLKDYEGKKGDTSTMVAVEENYFKDREFYDEEDDQPGIGKKEFEFKHRVTSAGFFYFNLPGQKYETERVASKLGLYYDNVK